MSEHNTEISLQQLERIFSEIPFNRMLGLKLAAIAADHICIEFTMKKELIGNYTVGILHGGVISSVLDMAGGIAAMAVAIQKHTDKDFKELAHKLSKSSTINLHIDYMQPGRGENFSAKAFVLHSGNKITFTKMELHNQDRILIATGAATYLVG